MGLLERHVAATTWAPLPTWPNDRLIPVWTDSGHPQYLDATQAPVALFAVGHVAEARKALALAHGRKMYLVAAAFPTSSLAAAEARAATVSRKLGGVPVYMLQGSWQPWAPSLPALLWEDPWATKGQEAPLAGMTQARMDAAYAQTMAGLPAR
ncbi:MAG: hypothetical protein K6V73_11365 [Firmicutes bacterium]|nr:hypothetical protein [Bacillota bacterium]